VSTWSPGNAAERTQVQGAIAGPGRLHAPDASEAGEGPDSPGQILAPVQGTIVKVLVGVGDRVLEDQAICVIEAMKMEDVVQAALAGSVTEVRVAPGDSVDSGTVIAVIRP
jgi:acetyl-CoA/propionyl-CoA carboxylase, biotin carboxylase, biotin carboxyl carrier protein